MIVKMHHFGMMVKDLDISIRNYETLGFKVYKRFTKPGMKAAMLFNGNAGIEFFEFENPEDGDALKIKKHSAFESDDLEYDVDQYLKLGYKLAIPISKGSVVKRFAYLQDNADNYIELLEP